ncbi:prostaglandin E2 receptor EP2 subtype-like [Littorina saxatilis]|uniref:Thromboxane A2 receptor n=1 Tax=Littorina saxatilis TaxID=31220 RepID=A0AAN9G9T0_9CAEN
MAVLNLTESFYGVDNISQVAYDIINSNNISNGISIIDSLHNVSQPERLQWMASATVSTRSDHDVTVTLSSDLAEGQGQATIMMLGQLMVNTNGDNGTAMPAKDFTAMKNHTVMVSCLMFGAGVLGNLLALFVLATSSADQRKTLFYKLVAGLAVTDLLGTVATSPVVIAVYLNDFQWVGGDAMCHYFSFAMIFAGFATMLIVCTMSVERYVCVRHPYIYHARLSGTKFARLTLVTCWAISITIASLPLLGVGTNVKQFPMTWCFFDYTSRDTSDVVFNYIYAIAALICVMVTFVCNVSVIYTLVTLRSRQSKLDASEGSQTKRRSRATSQRFAEVQMMIMLIGITIVFTFCFAPLMIFVLVCQADVHFDSPRWVLTLIRLASFNPILDPWVYILFRRELVWRVVKLVRWLLRLRPIQPPLHYQQTLLIKDIRGVGGGGGGGGVGVVVNGGGDCGGEKSRWDDPYNPSCLVFCYQCLCLPPAPRIPASMMSHRLSVTTFNRSPSMMTSPRKTLSLDQLSSRSPSRSIVIKPPSPSDRLLLIKMTEGAGSTRSISSTV